jgi:hypothetical protein
MRDTMIRGKMSQMTPSLEAILGALEFNSKAPKFQE